jgi:DNA-binding MarR family transcriptional regulator
MDPLKEAFRKIKEDMDLLRGEILSLNQDIREIRDKLDANTSPTHNPLTSTDISINPTGIPLFKALKPQNIPLSTGNEGVPTDRQTNQQTNQQTEKASFNKALEVLNSLDNLKKEIRNKFKRITDQEFLVFSTIYQIEEESGSVDYRTLSQKLNLTESSIRDYVGKLIKKGIPVDKIKINNKMVQLSISEKLKKVTPLPVIFQLREI